MTTPSVDASEELLRQVGPGGNPIYFDSTQIPPVHQSVFLPTRKDNDGLSMIRSRFRSKIWADLRDEQPHVRFRLVVLKSCTMVEIAREAGFDDLTYSPSPDRLDTNHGEPWAHCSLREVNRSDYDSNQTLKRRIKEWAMRTSLQVTMQDVIGPFDKPTPNDSYRPDIMRQAELKSQESRDEPS